MMKKTAGTLILCLGVTVLAAATTEASALHFQLNDSAPKADTRVESPEEVRLWFSQVPQENSMSIRLVDADGELVETGDVEQDAEDGKIFSIAMEGALTPAAYTVAWRAIGQDGHVVRGDFVFHVTTQE